MESTYAETILAILDKIPETIDIPPYFDVNDPEANSGPCVPNDRRRFLRRKTNAHLICQLTSSLPTFPREARVSRVIALDLSRSGMRYLIDHQQYPEEEVVLWTLGGKIPCKVARCKKHNDRCYEIGVEMMKAL